MVAMLGGLAVVASLGITACSDRAVAPTEQASTLAKQPGGLGPLSTANIGAYHNQFLDFVYPRLKDAVAHGGGRAGACRAIARAMREFVVIKGLRRDGTGIADNVAGEYCADVTPSSADGKARRSLSGDGIATPALESIIEEMAYAVAENRPVSELRSFFDARLAYARAALEPAEAEVAAASASVALSSAEYWDANYATQEAELRATLQEAYSRGTIDHFTLSGNDGSFALLHAPGNPLKWGWLDKIRNSPWYPPARKVGGTDLSEGFKGAASAIGGGWAAMLENALVRGAAGSAGELVRQVTK